MTIPSRAFYTSAEGETWSLLRTQEGEIVVSQQLTDAQPDNALKMPLGTFLAESNTGPEHRALRQLIGQLIEANNVPAEYDDHD